MPRVVRACSLLLGALVLCSTWARAQTSCTPTNQGGLLAQFSDNASPGSIAPAAIRNVICSALLQQGTGATAQAITVAVSPFIYTTTSVGTVTVDSATVAISRNNGTTFYTVGTAGAAVPVLTGDQVRVTYTTPTPVMAFLPSGPSQ